MAFDGCEQAKVCEVGYNGLPRTHAVHAAIGVRCVVIDAGVGVQDVDAGQIVALAHGVVVEVVGRCDLDAACAELGVHMRIADDGDLASDKRQPRARADQVAVARIVGVHREPRVAQHRFRPGRCDDDMIRSIRRADSVQQRVANAPQVAVFRHVVHFQVRYGRLQDRVPVDQAFLLVDQPVFVEPHEDFVDGGTEALVHGESIPRPVQRRSHAPKLLRDLAPREIAPLPDPFQERFASDVVAAYSIGLELALNDHLGGDAGVVGPHLPKCLPAFHALVANQRVHEGVLEPMPQVEAAGDVRRWNGDAEGSPVARRREVTVGLPLGV